MRRAAIQILLAIMLASTVAFVAPAAASDNPQDCVQNNRTSTGSINGTVQLTDADNHRIQIEYDAAPSTDDKFTVDIHPSNVVSDTGFVEAGDGSLEWDNSTNAPSVTYESAPVGADDKDPVYRAPWHSDTVALNTDTGLVSQGLMYLGDHYHVYTRDHGCETIRIVASCKTELAAEPKELLDGLEASASQFDAGNRYEEVTFFPVEYSSGATVAGQAFGSDLAVKADTEVNRSGSVWVHEYIHARQGWEVERGNMTWFAEASASYYSAELPRRAGSDSNSSYNTWLEDGGSDKVLAEPYDPDREFYDKGPLVLHELDQRIRDASNGEHSLDDVFRRVNEDHSNDPVTYAEFRSIVASLSSHSTANWLDEHVETEKSPEYDPLYEESFWESFELPSASDVVSDTRNWVSDRVASLTGFFSDDPVCLHGNEPSSH